MRLCGLSIDGFGVYHNVDLRDLPGGLVLFLGNNEAGKSTLLEFIRTILFGFPKGTVKRTVPPPLNGGQHGGRLMLKPRQSPDQNPWIVQRHAGAGGGPMSITMPDGTPSGEDALRHLLGQATRELLHNIFAFGLGELQNLESLQAEAVRDAIYGASAGMALQTQAQVKARLRNRIEELFRPQGGSPLINRLLDELRGIQAALRVARGVLDEYEEVTRRLAEVEALIHTHQEGIGRVREEILQTEIWIRCWEDWSLLGSTRRELEAIPEPIAHFPERGLERLEQLSAQRDQRRMQLGEVAASLLKAREEHERIEVDTTLLGQAELLARMRERRQLFVSALENQPRLRLELQAQEDQTRQALGRLGAGWTGEKVRAANRSVAVLEELLVHERALAEAQTARLRAQDLHADRAQELERARKEEEAAREVVRGYGEPAPLPDAEVVRLLQNERAVFIHNAQELPGATRERDSSREWVNAQTVQIDPGWTDRQVRELDTGTAAREQLASFDQRFARLEGETQTTKQVRQSARERLEKAKAGLSQANRELEKVPAFKAHEAPAVRKAAIVSLRRELETRDRRKVQCAHCQHRLKDREEELRRLRLSIEEYTGGLQDHTVLALVLLGLLLGGGLFLLGELVFKSEQAGSFRIAGLLVCGVGLMMALLLWSLQRFRKAKTEPVGRSEELSRLEAQIEELRLDHERAQSEERRGEELVQELSTALALKGTVTPADLDKAEDDLAEAIKRQEQRERLLGEQQRQEAEVRECQRLHEAAEAEYSARAAELSQTRSLWQERLTQMNLKPETRPRTVETIFLKAEEIRKTLALLEDQEKRVQGLQAALEAYRQAAARIEALREASLEPPERLVLALDGFLEEQARNAVTRKELEAAQRTLLDRQLRRQGLEDEAEQLRQGLEQARSQEGARQEAWRQWLGQHGLEAELSPQTAREALQWLERAAQSLELEDRLSRASAEEEGKVRLQLQWAGELYQALGRELPPAAELAVALDGLGSELEAQQAASLRKEEALRRVRQLEEQLAIAERGLAEQTQLVQALVAEGGAADEAGFRGRAERFASRQALLERRTQAERNLTRLSGKARLEEIAAALEGLSLQQLQDRRAQQQGLLEGREQALRASLQEQAELRTRQRRLATDEEVSRLRAREERVLTGIRGAARDYARHAVAVHLLDSARQVFEREHQPKVLREAAGFFQDLTGGRYSDVRSVLGRNTLQIMARDGSVLAPEQLSRGTAEQLYLAVRFGYIRNYALSGEPLPVVMDDILVNFDPSRASRAARAILHLAETNQVFFFTCHPETVNRFREARPELPLYHIVGNGIQRTA